MSKIVKQGLILSVEKMSVPKKQQQPPPATATKSWSPSLHTKLKLETNTSFLQERDEC